VWNACGYARSFNYDEKGNWAKNRYWERVKLSKRTLWACFAALSWLHFPHLFHDFFKIFWISFPATRKRQQVLRFACFLQYNKVVLARD
jgi:hypothetical protein